MRFLPAAELVGEQAGFFSPCFSLTLWFRRNPKVFLQLAPAAFVKAHSLRLEHSLLLVVWENDAAGRTAALSINNSMPWSSVVGAVHHKAYGSRRVAFAENFSELAVSHDASARDLPNDAVNSFSIIAVRFFGHELKVFGILLERAQDRARRRPVTAAAGDLQRQANQFIEARRHGS